MAKCNQKLFNSLYMQLYYAISHYNPINTQVQSRESYQISNLRNFLFFLSKSKSFTNALMQGTLKALWYASMDWCWLEFLTFLLKALFILIHSVIDLRGKGPFESLKNVEQHWLNMFLDNPFYIFTFNRVDCKNIEILWWKYRLVNK